VYRHAHCRLRIFLYYYATSPLPGTAAADLQKHVSIQSKGIYFLNIGTFGEGGGTRNGYVQEANILDGGKTVQA